MFTPSMGRTICTEPQCLYKGELYFTFTLQFTLKQLRHVSVLQLHHHKGAHQFVLTKVTIVKIVH